MKTVSKTSKIIATCDFLVKHDQPILAVKLYSIELNRLLLNYVGLKLNRAHANNHARYDDVRIDVDHFILIHNEKG